MVTRLFLVHQFWVRVLVPQPKFINESIVKLAATLSIKYMQGDLHVYSLQNYQYYK